MKQIGLISNYFPFMSPMQRMFVRQLVLEAENYRDFVIKLMGAINEGKAGTDLLPFAMRYLWALGDLQQIAKTAETYGEQASLLPWYIHALFFAGEIPRPSDAAKRLREALRTQKADWVRFEGRVLLAFILGHTKSHETYSMIQDLEEEIRRKPVYEPFSSMIEHARGLAFTIEEDFEKATEHFWRSVQLADQYGDLFVKANSLNMLSIANPSVSESLELLSRSRDAFYEIGNLLFEGVIQNNIGFSKVAMAKYDEAIEHYNRSIEINEQVGYVIWNPYLNIAVLYGNLGQNDKALEYAKKALEIGKERRPDAPAPQIEMARALILSEETERAREYLEAGGELAFKSGSDRELCRYYLVRGMLEMTRGDYSSSVSTLRRGLRIADNTNEIYYILQILLQLAGAEVMLYSDSKEGEKIASANTALARLEQLSHEQQFSGLSAQVKLLKAEVDVIRGDNELARTRLEEALEICNKEGMLSLRSSIESRLKDIGEKKTRKSLIERFKNLIRQIAVPSGQTKKTPFQVLGCILILQHSGLEVYSEYIDPRLISDPSLVAGLISAVSNFAREIRQDATGKLQSIVHQDIAVLLEHGNHTTCALLADRDTYEARVLERRFLEKFEEMFSDSLHRFEDGAVEPLDAQPMFHSIVLKRKLGD